MTQPITIGMVSSYVGLNPSPIDWLWQQSPKDFGRWGDRLRISAPEANPDFLLLYQFDFPKPPKPLSLKDRMRGRQAAQLFNPETAFRGVDKSRRISLLREPPLEEVIAVNTWNYGQAIEHCGFVSGPDDAAPTPDYMPAIWYVDVSFRELDEMQAPVKTRSCSWITSGISRTENHRKRLAFLQQIHQSPIDCDIYGRDLPSWAQAGRLNNKWHAMAPYYYNLAIENYADNSWYASEKLWDSLLSWCLPIYYGGSAADKLLPPGSFLRLPSMDEKGIAYIKEMTSTPDAWYAAQDAIAEARQIILHKLNLLNWLSEYVEKF
jgi:hypothetical protein